MDKLSKMSCELSLENYGIFFLVYKSPVRVVPDAGAPVGMHFSFQFKRFQLSQLS